VSKNGKSALETLQDSGLLDNLDVADLDDMSADDLLQTIVHTKEFHDESDLKHQFQDIGLLRHSEELHHKLSHISASELLDKMERYRSGRTRHSRKLYSRAAPQKKAAAAPAQRPVQVQITINQLKTAPTLPAPKGAVVTQTKTAKGPAPQQPAGQIKKQAANNNKKAAPAPVPKAPKSKPVQKKPVQKGKAQNKGIQKVVEVDKKKGGPPVVNAAVVKATKKSKNAASRLTPGSKFATAASLKIGAALVGIIGGLWMGIL